MPHPRKNPVAFIPPLETAESIQIAVMNIARAVGAGQLDDRQARTMIAAIRQLRWAFQYRCEHPRPDPGTECPDAMANVLTLAYTDVEPEKCGTDSPSLSTADTPVRADDKRYTVGATTCSTDIPVGDRCVATAEAPGPWQSPLLNLTTDAILTERQLDYCRFVLRYGFQHPEYDDASHRLQLAVKRPQIGLGSLA